MTTGPQAGDEPPTRYRDQRDFDAFPLHQALGVTRMEARPGFSRIRLKTSRLTMGGVGGSVHGGLLAALVDMAMLEALIPMFRSGEQAVGTAELNISFLRPALGEHVYAEATVVKKGRQLAVTEVSILDEEGRVCARGRTTYVLRQVAASGLSE